MIYNILLDYSQSKAFSSVCANLISVSLQGLEELKTEQLGGQEQCHQQAPIDWLNVCECVCPHNKTKTAKTTITTGIVHQESSPIKRLRLGLAWPVWVMHSIASSFWQFCFQYLEYSIQFREMCLMYATTTTEGMQWMIMFFTFRNRINPLTTSTMCNIYIYLAYESNTLGDIGLLY